MKQNRGGSKDYKKNTQNNASINKLSNEMTTTQNHKQQETKSHSNYICILNRTTKYILKEQNTNKKFQIIKKETTIEQYSEL